MTYGDVIGRLGLVMSGTVLVGREAPASMATTHGRGESGMLIHIYGIIHCNYPINDSWAQNIRSQNPMTFQLKTLFDLWLWITFSLDNSPVLILDSKTMEVNLEVSIFPLNQSIGYEGTDPGI